MPWWRAPRLFPLPQAGTPVGVPSGLPGYVTPAELAATNAPAGSLLTVVTPNEKDALIAPGGRTAQVNPTETTGGG
jgi:hypothetical protein